MTPSQKGLEKIDDWNVLCEFLPPGWEEQARLSGALRRARGISSPGALLRVLLIHLGSGCSLAETATRAREAGLGQMSAVAVFKRLQAAEPWLRWAGATDAWHLLSLRGGARKVSTGRGRNGGF